MRLLPLPPLTERVCVFAGRWGTWCFLSFFSSLSPLPPFPKEDFKHNRRGLEENSLFQLNKSPCSGPRLSVHMCSCALVLIPSWQVRSPAVVSLVAQHSDWIESIFSSKS